MLTEAGIIFRQRREDKRVLRVALFNLLQLWHETRPVNIDEFLAEYLRIVKERYPDIGEDNLPNAEVTQMMTEMLEEKLKPQRHVAVATMADSYEQAVTKIAAADPLLALSLAGRSKVELELESYYDSLEDTLKTVADPNSVANADILSKAIRNSVRKVASTVVEDDILQIAKAISWHTARKTKKFLDRQRLKPQKDVNEKLRRFIADYLGNIEKEYYAKHPLGN